MGERERPRGKWVRARASTAAVQSGPSMSRRASGRPSERTTESV